MPEAHKLHEAVAAVFPGLEVVLGWGVGFDPLRTKPIFIRQAADIERLVWNPLCVHNLSGYLVKPPAIQVKEAGKRIGIVARGCDSKSLVALMQEKFVSRDQLHIFGVPCSGTIDWRRVLPHLGRARVRSVRVEAGFVEVEHSGGTLRLPESEALARRCQRCRTPNPVVYDTLIGEPVEPRVGADAAYRDVEAIEAKPLSERLAFWQTQLYRCIRCYACRNACPLCVCQDRCIAETRDPKWLTQQVSSREKVMFHCIHAMHLAGRCTECGECERVCPMGIPVALMKEKLSALTREKLDYEAGIDPEATPPLLTYSASETGI